MTVTELQTFVAQSRASLAHTIASALAGEQPPEAVRESAEAIMDVWDNWQGSAPGSLLPGEESLWCAVWAAQHLGDSEHWADGVAQRELRILLPILERGGRLPSGYRARRP